jgi:hypothetical protein
MAVKTKKYENKRSNFLKVTSFFLFTGIYELLNLIVEFI